MINSTKKFLLSFILIAGAAACSKPMQQIPSTTPRPEGGQPIDISTIGNATSRGAVEQYLAAIRTEDLQAVSLIWGTEKGAARDNMPRDEMEKRTIVMISCLNHDKYRILGESTVSSMHRMVEVEIGRGDQVKVTTIHTVLGPRNKWFVEKTNLAQIREFCSF